MGKLKTTKSGRGNTSKYSSSKNRNTSNNNTKSATGWLTRSSGDNTYKPGQTSYKTNPLFNIKKHNNFFAANSIIQEANKISGTQDKMKLIQNQLALDSANGKLYDDNSWTGGMMNRYVADAMETANKKKDKTILDDFFNNIDGMTNKALTNSKLGIVFSGFDSRTLANKILSGQDVVNLENVDELNKYIMDFNKVDWKLLYNFGKNNLTKLTDPNISMKEKWSIVNNFTRFGSTPNLIGNVLSGESSSKV